MDNNYVADVGPFSMDTILEKKNHNIMMIDIASTLNYVEFVEVKIVLLPMRCRSS